MTISSNEKVMTLNQRVRVIIKEKICLKDEDTKSDEKLEKHVQKLVLPKFNGQFDA